jgi:hypothetical protein
MPLYKLLRKGD